MIIDLHCDTFTKMYDNKMNSDAITRNGFSIDIGKLKKGKVVAQCFAIFNDMGSGYNTQKMYDVIDYMFDGLEKSGDVYLYNGYDDFLSNAQNGKICAIPTIEDLGPILGDISNIDKLHEMGFKILSLTWNYENTLAYPNSSNLDTMNKCLKEFGIEVIHRMNELNMIIDVSHLSDGGFYDVAKMSSKPFVATHSNARAMTNHQRNLTDDMIKTLSDAGGVTGINFCPDFLCDDGSVSRVDDMIRHVKHIYNIGGIECIAIGSDFDGINGNLELSDASQYSKLISALGRAGFTIDEIDKITHKNVLRVLKDSE